MGGSSRGGSGVVVNTPLNTPADTPDSTRTNAALATRAITALRRLSTIPPQAPLTERTSVVNVTRPRSVSTIAESVGQTRGWPPRSEARAVANLNGATVPSAREVGPPGCGCAHSPEFRRRPHFHSPLSLAGGLPFAGRAKGRTPANVSDLIPPAVSPVSPAPVVVVAPAPVVVVAPPVPRLCSHCFPSPPSVRKRSDALSSLMTTVPRRSPECLVFPANLQLTPGILSEFSGAIGNLADW